MIILDPFLEFIPSQGRMCLGYCSRIATRWAGVERAGPSAGVACRGRRAGLLPSTENPAVALSARRVIQGLVWDVSVGDWTFATLPPSIG